MPIVLTPVLGPSTSTVTCDALQTVRPRVTRVENVEVPERLRAVALIQNQTATVRWQFLDPQGDPVDLTDCGFDSSSSSSASDHTLEARAREALSFKAQVPTWFLEPTVIDATTGLVDFAIPAEAVLCPGVLVVEPAVLKSDGYVLFRNKLFLYVGRSLFATQVTDQGPPDEAEIRLQLRDSGAADNYLLQNTEWDLAEICMAIIRTVMYWNESRPPVRRFYSTATFRFQGQAFEGVKGQLCLNAAAGYRRNDVLYSAAGVSFDDKRKQQEYEQIGRQCWADYAKWVRLTKAGLNAEAAFGTLASRYGYFYRW